MSDVNSNIPLAIDPTAMAGPDLGKVLTLADMAGSLRMKQQQIVNQNTLKQILSNPGSYDPKTGTLIPQALQATMAVDPKVGMELKDQALQEKLNNWKIKSYETEQGKQKFDFASQVAGVSYDAYQSAIKSGKNDRDARAAAVEARSSAVKAANGFLSNEEISQIEASPFDPAMAKTFAMANDDYSKRTMKEKEEQDVERHEKTQETLDKGRLEVSRGELALGNRKQNYEESNPSLNYSSPGEVEYTDEKGTVRRADAVYDPKSGKYLTAVGHNELKGSEFRPLKGGEAGLGNRAEVFLQRVMTAGNEAATAAKNIMELPLTSTRGVVGGRTQGTSLLSAAQETLVNKMTTQEVQDYNTMVAGVTRNLSSIEAGGLAPPGSLTHSMDAIVLKEGDSNLTKMRRMAEMRQIVEKGLEPNLANPKIPVEQKDFINGIITNMREAIPFTQHDLTQFEQQSGKHATFNDYINKTALKFSSTEEADKAGAAGKIDSGQRIIIDGRPAVWTKE